MTTAAEVRRAIRALPRGGPAEIVETGTPVILAPHPDDEVIGCGGFLAAAVREGVSPAIVFVTDGSGSHPNSRSFPRNALIALRQREARAAAKILGVDLNCVYFLGIRDTAAPHDGPPFADAVNAILKIVEQFERPILFAPWVHDPHGDHVAVHKMAQTVAGILAARHLSYLVWGWTLPDDQELSQVDVAGWRLRLNGDKARKSLALDAYQSQLSDLIDDDPTGFRLDRDTLKAMLSDDEVFLLNP